MRPQRRRDQRERARGPPGRRNGHKKKLGDVQVGPAEAITPHDHDDDVSPVFVSSAPGWVVRPRHLRRPRLPARSAPAALVARPGGRRLTVPAHEDRPMLAGHSAVQDINSIRLLLVIARFLVVLFGESLSKW